MVQQKTLYRRACCRYYALLLLCWALASLATPGVVAPALAQSLSAPSVRYDALTKIIYVGANYNRNNPAEAPFIGYPSHPDAPKSSITIPTLASLLQGQGYNDLLVDLGDGDWLLSADLVISPTARLEATAATIKALRLDSTPDRFPALTRVIAPGGHLRFEGISVTSWDRSSGTVDTEYRDGRSYLLASSGGRMDIINAEVAYLGWADGEPSGLSWRKRATESNPQTGATGSIINSNIHHNYFGQYSYEAYGLRVFYSEFHHNIYYGFDPHDFSMNFEVAYNRVYRNGKHGIIFSRGCEWNWIHHNEVFDNAEHGIMLDRGTNNNKISDNIVYNNRDGVAIFQSSYNLVQNNLLYDNERGIRVNATYDVNDIYDGISIQNALINNIIRNNSQYGIYLYERADKNTIAENEITGNATSGIYIKTGGNKIEENVISGNGHGITIIGGELSAFPPGGPTPVPAEEKPGRKNSIQANNIENNNSAGIQLRGAVETLIGPRNPDRDPGYANIINTNGTQGISINDAAADNLIIGNTIQGNGREGVRVRGATTMGNTISRNSIAANARQGIVLSEGANRNVTPPTVSTVEAGTVRGTAAPRAKIEIYRDSNGQGRIYKGATTADESGAWSFALPADDNTDQGAITALATTSSGDTSAFGSLGGGGVRVAYEMGSGRNGELTLYVSGPGATVTLPDIQRNLQIISPTLQLLENQGNGVWQANVSLFINRGVTLTLTSDTVTWLKLRSQGSDIVHSTKAEPIYNYKSFVALRTYNGTILIDGVKISSWDPTTNTYDMDVSNGRSFLLAKYDARMDILNAEIAYLGSGDGESYGLSWRDTNDTDEPDVLRTRVTGQVINSDIHHNYYGIYTYQASYMVFRGNKFRNNIGYGFDPHDFSNHFVVEDNEAFENGNHGFIISRGCNNFVFRRNKSYNNRYTVDDKDRNAHGFMIDPGSPNSRYPQVPSFENLLEDNQAWGNDGYGLRILGSISNTVRANVFVNNLQGITVERGSTGNIFENNTVSNNTIHGIFVNGGSDNNRIVGNTVGGNGRHGIYIKTGGNIISRNRVNSNGTPGSVPEGAGIALLPEADTVAATDDLRLPATQTSLATRNPELLSDLAQATPLTGNLISENSIVGNADDGIEIKGARQTIVQANSIERSGAHGIYLSAYNAFGAVGNVIKANQIRLNRGHGIRANGTTARQNTWSENRVFNNMVGGIAITSGANDALAAPRIVQQEGRTVIGTATPGTVVEIFSDTGGQGLYFEGSTTTNADGSFSFTAAQNWRAPNLNATATDANGNSSAFTYNRRGSVPFVYLPLVLK